MTTIILGVSLLSLGVLSGFYFSERYEKRNRFYKDITEFNANLISNITFNLGDLSKVLNSKYPSEDLNNLLLTKYLSSQGKTVEYNFPNYLTKNEIADLKGYFDKIGRYDADTCLNRLKQYNELFRKKHSETQQDQHKTGVLIKKLGLICGLIAFIIVV